jgi:hypothetical protein
MSQGQTGWLLLFLLALFLVVIGFQGSLGVVFAILFSPMYVTLDE